MPLLESCAKYVGVPFVERGDDVRGWDCWGAYHYIGVNELGKSWPSCREAYEGLHSYDRREIAKAISRYIGDWHRIEKPVPGCAVAFDRRGDVDGKAELAPSIYHIGMMMNARLMLHVVNGAHGGTVIVPHDGLEYRRFFAGFWERS